MSSLVRVIAINVVVLVVILAVLEFVLQAFSSRYPAYDVLAVEPDPIRGWKLVPNLEYTWTGYWWYANDYSVRVKYNSHGFRDLERNFPKTAGSQRAAILGDSFVEAREVALDMTAAGLLEADLNLRGNSTWEVLNFGTSSYSLGQSLLTWQEEVIKFDPDYVFLYVSSFNMIRTVSQSHEGLIAKEDVLRIRPIYSYDSQKNLIHQPASDYEKFVAIQNDLLREKFTEDRSSRRTFVLPFFIKKVVSKLNEKLFSDKSQNQEFSDILAINMDVLNELRTQVELAGARLIIVDINGYWGVYAHKEETSRTLEDFCKGRSCGYVPAYKPLVEARNRGVNLRWERDGHFNEIANRLVADTLLEWFREEGLIAK